MKQVTALWVLMALTAAATVLLLLRIESIQAHQNDALSAVICHAEKLVRSSTGITVKQKNQAIRFYARQIRDEHLTPCSSR